MYTFHQRLLILPKTIIYYRLVNATYHRRSQHITWDRWSRQCHSPLLWLYSSLSAYNTIDHRNVIPPLKTTLYLSFRVYFIPFVKWPSTKQLLDLAVCSAIKYFIHLHQIATIKKIFISIRLYVYMYTGYTSIVRLSLTLKLREHVNMEGLCINIG